MLIICLITPVLSKNQPIDLNQTIDQIKLTGATPRISHQLKKQTWHVQKGKVALPLDVQKDINQLFSTGFFNTVSAKTTTKKNQFILSYVVQVNPEIMDIKWVGNSLFTQKELEKKLRHKKGDTYNYNWLTEDQLIIKKTYLDNKNTLFKLKKIYFNKKNKTLYFSLDEGRVNQIKIEGLSRFKSQYLIRDFLTKENQVLNQEDIIKDRRLLIESSYFSVVQWPKYILNSNNEKYDVVYTVKEKKTNHFSVGLENEEEELVAFSRISKKDLFIKTDQVLGKIQLTNKSQATPIRSISVAYQQPWIFNHWPITGTVDIYKKIKKSIISSEQLTHGPKTMVDTIRQGAYVTLGHQFYKKRITTKLRVKYEAIKSREESALDPYQLTSIKTSLEYRTKTMNFNPKKGGYTTLSLERGGNLKWLDLGGLSFIAVKANAAIFKSILNDSVIGLHVAIDTINFDHNPGFESEGFMLGGASTLRGYHDDTFEFVGERRVRLNTEFRTNISKNWQWVLFLDLGKTFETGFDILNQLQSGYGFGIRYFTPIGPIRVDFARGQANMIHFSIGQMF